MQGGGGRGERHPRAPQGGVRAAARGRQGQGEQGARLRQWLKGEKRAVAAGGAVRRSLGLAAGGKDARFGLGGWAGGLAADKDGGWGWGGTRGWGWRGKLQAAA